MWFIENQFVLKHVRLLVSAEYFEHDTSTIHHTQATFYSVIEPKVPRVIENLFTPQLELSLVQIVKNVDTKVKVSSQAAPVF